MVIVSNYQHVFTLSHGGNSGGVQGCYMVVQPRPMVVTTLPFWYGMSFHSIAENFNIAISTAHHTYKNFEMVGDVAQLQTSIEELIVIGLMLENPRLSSGQSTQSSGPLRSW